LIVKGPYSTTRSRKPAVKKASPDRVVKPLEVMGLIQGIMPGSIEEWRLSKSLDKYKIQYKYQVPLWGGYLRGSQRVDFVLIMAFEIPCQVMGRRWHSGKFGVEDEYKLARIQRHYRRKPIIFWDDELDSQEESDSAVRSKIVNTGGW
jgi:hypothetical protein